MTAEEFLKDAHGRLEGLRDAYETVLDLPMRSYPSHLADEYRHRQTDAFKAACFDIASMLRERMTRLERSIEMARSEGGQA